jgi:FADH2-dependent halogenase
MHEFDVAILGGGPAGSSAAIALKRLGRSVVVFERDRFPRFHIGESLLPTTNEMLDSLDLRAAVSGLGFPKKLGATFLTGDGAIERYADFTSANEVKQPQTWQVRRDVFDRLLLDTARERGADVRQEHRVLGVEFDDSGATVEFQPPAGEASSLRARMVLDASGRWGLLARKFDLRRDEPGLKNIAIYSHYRGVPRPAGERSGDIRIVGRPDLGWFWLIPIAEDLTSVGVVLPRSVFDRLPRASHEEVLERAIAETPAVASLLARAEREWPVRVERDFTYRASAYAGDRWLLVGDAGSFLDPVFSTGVAIALESGLEAAAAADAACSRADFRRASFAPFERRQRRRYAAFRRFVLAFYSESFRDIFFQPGASRRVFAAVVTLLAGRWTPNVANRFFIAVFFLLVRVQRRFALVPRLASSAAPRP